MRDLSKPSELNTVAKTLGIKRESWGNGKSSYAMEVREEHCNKGGVTFGGIYTALLDMAMGGGLVSILPVEEWCATTHLSTSFISASYVGEKIIATGDVVKRGRHVAHLKGQIKSESGRLIASAEGTWAIWNAKPSSMG